MFNPTYQSMFAFIIMKFTVFQHEFVQFKKVNILTKTRKYADIAIKIIWTNCPLPIRLGLTKIVCKVFLLVLKGLEARAQGASAEPDIRITRRNNRPATGMVN